MRCLLFLCLLVPQEDSGFPKARDKFLEGVDESDPRRVRNTVDVVQQGRGDKAAKTLLQGLQKSRERLRVLDKAMGEAVRALQTATAKPNGTAADRADKARALEAATVRIRQVTHLWNDAEEIHELIRTSFGALRSMEAVTTVGDELLRAEYFQTRIEAADALAAMDQPVAEDLLIQRLAKEETAAVASAILEALGARGTLKEATVAAVAAKLGSTPWQVPMMAARTLASCGARGGVEPLIVAMRTADGRPRLEINAALKKLTKADMYGSPDAWADWWKANGEAWMEGRYDPKNPARNPGPAMTFFAIPVHSKRVAFVIDRSRSMKETLKDGRRKIDLVKAELKALITALPDGVRIHLVFFNEKLEVHSRELDARSRKDAVAFIDAIECDGITDLWEPIQKAFSLCGNPEMGTLREDGLDTVYLLSDGAPTTGRIADPDLLATVVTRLNRTLRVSINTVAVGDVEKLLDRLAERNDGKAVTR